MKHYEIVEIIGVIAYTIGVICLWEIGRTVIPHIHIWWK
jgi:hypothetical protein